jgi:hypothetical protein
MNIQIKAFQLALLPLLDAQASICADLALRHYQGRGTQGPGYHYWSAARDSAVEALEQAQEIVWFPHG